MLESGGTNCCKCEKCYRTILEIVSEGGEPNAFGFQWDTKNIIKCRFDMQTKIRIRDFEIAFFYLPIQRAFAVNRKKIRNYKKYRWITKMDFNNFNSFFLKRIRRRLGIIKRKLLKCCKMF